MPRVLLILTLVIAGELVFGLAYNVPRFFRPTMLDVFGITNTQLGDMFAVCGITAMISYFPGGAIADRFSARSLMAVSLLLTALGGLYMATIPGVIGMTVLYGYWGVTTILMFWAAMIRATRDWGGNSSQGIAFGLLDGGRGLVAASVAFAAVVLLAAYLPDEVTLATSQERLAGFRAVVIFYTVATGIAAALVWSLMPVSGKTERSALDTAKSVSSVLRRPVVWAQAAIVVCAYCGYKGLDNYSLYAVQVLGMNEVEAARLATYGAWTRPVAAILAGVIADRFNAANSIAVMFVVLAFSYFSLSLADPTATSLKLIYGNFLATYVFVFALRGIYFALLEENKTPRQVTGSTVGVISVVGYTPDIFFGPIAGRILDANPGLVGHQNYFRFLAAIAVAGLASVAVQFILRRPQHHEIKST